MTASLVKNNFWGIQKRERFEFGTISAADITGTTAGQFGHANGYPMCPVVGTGESAELIGVTLFYDFSVAAYTAGGNITVNISGGGAAVTGLISAANSVGAASDKIAIFYPLAASVGTTAAANTGFNLVTSAAFTQPGTAAGVIKYRLLYRVYDTTF